MSQSAVSVNCVNNIVYALSKMTHDNFLCPGEQTHLFVIQQNTFVPNVLCPT